MEEYTGLQSRIPIQRIIKVRCEADFYGASYEIAERLGIIAPPRSFASWIHGSPLISTSHPQQVLSSDDKSARHLVATKEQRDALLQFGYMNVQSVGAPFVYATEPQVPRIPNSILIMPGHSSAVYKPPSNEERYLEELTPELRNFSFVCACISPSCLKNNRWVQALKKRKIPWILGANSRDRFALRRMRVILSSFEFTTSNTIGSHLVYAAYSGSKPSIFGTFQEIEKEEAKNCLIYKRFPELLQLNMNRLSSTNLKSLYPWLFTVPNEATLNTEWANKLLGQENKKEPSRLANLLGWSYGEQIRGYFKMMGSIPKRVKLYFEYGQWPMWL